MSYRLADLEALVAETHEQVLNLDVAVECGGLPQVHRYRSVDLSANIATQRTRSIIMDVLLDLGVEASLDVLIQGQDHRDVNLQVYIKSAALRVGASAIYNESGDEVESILYVQDGEVLHPEFIEAVTSTLLYRRQVLGTVSLDHRNGTADGTVTSLWIHPAHTSELSIRYRGTIAEIGAVDFTVPVETGESIDEEVPLGENTLESLDHEVPRTEPSSFATKVQHLDPAPEEVETLAPEVVLTLLRVNLLRQYGYLEAGTGPVDYRGGGSRLLALLADGSYVLQVKDQFPPDLAAHTRIEAQGSNLLTNSSFQTPTNQDNPVPLGYGLTAPGSVTVLPGLDTARDYEVFKFRCFGSGPYVGPKKVVFLHQNPVVLSTLDPVTFSILARTEYVQAGSIIRDLRAVVSFRDSLDVELSKVTVDYDPAAIRGTNFTILQATGTPPVGTTGARVSLELESIEASDDIWLFLSAPQLEVGSAATSRIIGTSAPVNRTADVLRVPQKNNLEHRRGSITMIFAPDYSGQPPGDACLFDTRDAAGINGYAGYHLADGKFRFLVAGPVATKILESSSSFILQAGILVNLTVQWSQDLMNMLFNEQLIAEDTAAVSLPQVLNEWIYLAQTTTGLDRFEGEVASFEIRRDVIT